MSLVGSLYCLNVPVDGAIVVLAPCYVESPGIGWCQAAIMGWLGVQCQMFPLPGCTILRDECNMFLMK